MKKEAFIQFIKFGIVGGINTLLSIILDNLFYYIILILVPLFLKNDVLRAGISTLLTFIITVFISYMLNGHFVFKPDSSVPFWKSLMKVYISYSFTSLFLNFLLKALETGLLGLPYWLCTFVNLIITVPINFLLNKFWAYK